MLIPWKDGRLMLQENSSSPNHRRRSDSSPMHAGDPSTAVPPPPPGMPAPHHQAQALLYPSFPYPPPAPSDPPSAPLLFSHIPNPNPKPEPVPSVIPAPYPATYLQGCTAPEVPALAYYPVGGVGGTLSVGAFGYGSICQNGQTAITDLEMKKQKLIQGGAPAGAVRVCAICNVVCNSEKVFVSHLAGEKHKAVVRGNALVPMPLNHIKLTNQVQKTSLKATRPVYCEVCKLKCNSIDVFNTHIQGKKHIKKLQQNNLTSAPIPYAEKKKGTILETMKTVGHATVEDLETKKRKVVAQGAAVYAVRTCTFCNVVCNSQKVFESHLLSQKHAARLKALEQLVAPGGQVQK